MDAGCSDWEDTVAPVVETERTNPEPSDLGATQIRWQFTVMILLRLWIKYTDSRVDFVFQSNRCWLRLSSLSARTTVRIRSSDRRVVRSKAGD